MENINQEIINYRKKNNLSIKDCSKKLEISEDELILIEENKKDLTEEESKRILSIISDAKPKLSIRRLLDLIFRLGSAVMALVVMLLCINGFEDTNILVALLSVGVVCSSITILPKIDK